MDEFVSLLFKKRTKPEPELLQWADNLGAEHSVVD